MQRSLRKKNKNFSASVGIDTKQEVPESSTKLQTDLEANTAGVQPRSRFIFCL